MSEKINGRTAEEIKKWLNCLAFECGCDICGECEYDEFCEYPGTALLYAPKAIALIERLEAERDSFKKAFDEALELNAVQAKSIKVLSISKRMQWISVKERFPEKGDKVLISLCGCNVKEAKYCGDGIFEAAYADTYHAMRTGAIVLTHWMPMPDPAETLKRISSI